MSNSDLPWYKSMRVETISDVAEIRRGRGDYLFEIKSTSTEEARELAERVLTAINNHDHLVDLRRCTLILTGEYPRAQWETDYKEIPEAIKLLEELGVKIDID